MATRIHRSTTLVTRTGISLLSVRSPNHFSISFFSFFFTSFVPVIHRSTYLLSSNKKSEKEREREGGRERKTSDRTNESS